MDYYDEVVEIKNKPQPVQSSDSGKMELEQPPKIQVFRIFYDFTQQR